MLSPRRLAALVGVATALRMLAATGDLWLDEVWSLALVMRPERLDQVFWAVRHDNHHLLTGAWLYLLRESGAPPLILRLPVVLAGGLTPLAALRLEDRRAAAFWAVWLAAGWPLVQWGSEARGYGGLLLGLAVVTAEATRSRPDPRWLLGGAALAVLSHLGAAIGLVLAAILAAVHPDLPRPLGLRARVLARAWGPAAALAGAFGVAFAATNLEPGFEIGHTTAYTFPGLMSGWIVLLAATAGLPADAALLGVVGIGVLWVWAARSGDRVALVAALATIGAVTALAALQLPNTAYQRYWLPFTPLWTLAIARAAAAIPSRPVSTGLLLASMAVNLLSLVPLIRWQRGGPLAAVEALADDGARTVWAEPPKYYAHVAAWDPGRLRGVTLVDGCGVEPPDGLVIGVATRGPAAVAGPARIERCGVAYERRGGWPYAGFSGWGTIAYLRVDAGR